MVVGDFTKSRSDNERTKKHIKQIEISDWLGNIIECYP